MSKDNMKVDVGNLPDDPGLLKNLLTKSEAEKVQLTKEFNKKILLLDEEIQYWRNKMFSCKSEKLSEEDKRQGCLFNEAETFSEQPDDNEKKCRVEKQNSKINKW